MTKEYEAALSAHDAAIAVYSPVRAAYQAGTVSDAQFLAARAIYNKATEAFDAAFAIASGAE